MTATIRLVIAGSRTVYPSIADIDREVRELLLELWAADPGEPVRFAEHLIEVISGRSPGGGADDAGEAWARHHGIPVHPEPITSADVARWGKYLAPKARNARMAERATHALCFWDRKSNGTTDMACRMLIRDKMVRVVPYEQQRRDR